MRDIKEVLNNSHSATISYHPSSLQQHKIQHKISTSPEWGGVLVLIRHLTLYPNISDSAAITHSATTSFNDFFTALTLAFSIFNGNISRMGWDEKGTWDVFFKAKELPHNFKQDSRGCESPLVLLQDLAAGLFDYLLFLFSFQNKPFFGF
jgi:hypothetical protein